MNEITLQPKLNEIDESFLKIITVDDIQCVNARALHASLEVGRDFSTWIKDRIEKYGFIEGKVPEGGRRLNIICLFQWLKN